MTIELLDKREIIKEGDNYIWKTEYKAQLTKEDFDKNKEFLTNRVRLLKTHLKSLNPKQAVKEEEQKLLQQKEVKEHALRNFDTYWKEELKKTEARGLEEKEILKTFIEQFEVVKKVMLEKAEQKIKDEILSTKEQLEDAELNLKPYQNV